MKVMVKYTHFIISKVQYINTF